jgi:hypothetical protein
MYNATDRGARSKGGGNMNYATYHNVNPNTNNTKRARRIFELNEFATKSGQVD